MRTNHLLPLAFALAAGSFGCAPSEAGAAPHRGPARTETAEPPPSTRPNVAPTLTATATVDLNHASAEELMRLPGVGKKRAEAVLARRAKRRFRTVEELRSVKGFGRKLYQKLRPRLRALP